MNSLFSLGMWLAGTQGPFSTVWQRLTDKTFRGLYQPNGFDVAILLPYFVVLVVLAAYGGHRYWLVYNFFKHRHVEPGPPPAQSEWPKVTIQLPVFNERYVVDRLVESVVRLDYPREKLEIQVLDDSTDETIDVARACVERCQTLGFSIHYLHRDNREGFKAGALAEGMKTATGEFICIFDADFQPHTDFLRRTIPYFQNPRIGMVQARWTYMNRHYSSLTEVEAILLDGHFVMEHGGRYREGSFFNFNGTAGVWRRTTIEDAGGWEHDTLTEDTDLSYRAQLRGWKFLYLMDLECPSELPVDMNSFKSQQARWAKGLTQVARKSLPRILRAPIPLHIKAEAFFHLTANLSYPLMMLLSTLLLPAMIVRFYQGWLQVLAIDLPLFLASTCSISSFYLMSQRELYPKTWKRSILYLPFVMALGIGIGVRNSIAVIEALLGIRSEFVRTPKFRIEGEQPENWIAKAYLRRSGWMPWLEVTLGVYFALAVVYSLQNENYATVPFLLLFVGGYAYTGAMSLGQGYLERMRFGLASGETRPAATGAPSF